MKRLLDDSLPPRAAALLRSAGTDVPPRAVERKARLVSVVAATAATTAARSRLPSGKWLGILSLVAVAGAGVVGSGYSLSPSSSAPSVSVAKEATDEADRQAPSAEGDTPNAAPSAPPPSQPAAISVTDLPSASPAISAARPKAPVVANADAPAPSTIARASDSAVASLADELKAVDEARAAFVAHDPALALNRVESYRHRFPSGRFMDETEALEIQSLAALGRSDEARAKAARFLAQHPESPYAQRVRSVVGSRSEH